MSQSRLRLDLPILLPDVPDARDACVGRLESMIGEKQGIVQSHVLLGEVDGRAVLCLHYDPETLSVREVERIAVRAGAGITRRFGHAVLPIRAIGGEDAARRIEHELRGKDGVPSASVSLAEQRVHVEFDRESVSLEEVRQALEGAGHTTAPATRPKNR